MFLNGTLVIVSSSALFWNARGAGLRCSGEIQKLLRGIILESDTTMSRIHGTDGKTVWVYNDYVKKV